MVIRNKGVPSLTDSFSDELEDLFNRIEDGKEIEPNNSYTFFLCMPSAALATTSDNAI
jgi:hypothetical protein